MFVGGWFAAFVCNVLGYVVPAYGSFKAVQSKDADAYRHWLMYWMIISVFTVLELFADVLVSWLPFYYEGKIAFIVWLAMFGGSKRLYEGAVVPFMDRFEQDIDRLVALVAQQVDSQIGRIADRLLATLRDKGLSLFATLLQSVESMRSGAAAGSAAAGANPASVPRRDSAADPQVADGGN